MRIGFIGVGNMGGPMAQNLLKAGHELKVLDTDRPRAQPLLDAGAQWAESPKEATSGSDIVSTALPMPADVDSVALGPDGIVEAASPGLVFIDFSTNSPVSVRKLSEELAPKGVAVLDAPMSGGVAGATRGTLAIMVGGERATFDKVKPVLDVLGDKVSYCGDIGSGSICKIVNNLVSMGIGLLMGEAFCMGVKAGADINAIAHAVGTSSGRNDKLTARWPQFLLTRNFKPGFALELAAKDVRLGTNLARELQVPMPLLNLVDQRYVEALRRGWGPEDADAIVRLVEEDTGIELRFPD